MSEQQKGGECSHAEDTVGETQDWNNAAPTFHSPTLRYTDYYVVVSGIDNEPITPSNKTKKRNDIEVYLFKKLLLLLLFLLTPKNTYGIDKIFIELTWKPLFIYLFIFIEH